MESVIPLLIQDSFFLLAILLARTLLIGRDKYRHIILLWNAALTRFLFPFPLAAPVDLIAFQSNQGFFVPHETPAHSLAQLGASWFTTSAGHAALEIWAIGMLLALTAHLVDHRRWVCSHPVISPVDDQDICSCAQKFELQRRRLILIRVRAFLGLFTNKTTFRPACEPQAAPTRARLFWADNLKSPVTYGFIFPVVLLPVSTASLSKHQKLHIVEHELTHIHRQDALFKFLLTLVCCCFWFNPLVWVMRKLVNQDIELACDETVTWFLAPSHKRSYASLLLQFASTSDSANYMDIAAFSSGAAPLLATRIRAMRRIPRQIDVVSFIECSTALLLALALSTTGIASSNNPWDIHTDAGCITLPEAWHEKVTVSTAKTADGSSVTMVFPLGQETHPLVAFGRVGDYLQEDASNTLFIEATADSGSSCTLWGFDYSDSVSELPKWDSSIPLVNAWQLSTGGNPDMDSLEFLQQEVAPTFRPA